MTMLFKRGSENDGRVYWFGALRELVVGAACDDSLSKSRTKLVKLKFVELETDSSERKSQGQGRRSAGISAAVEGGKRSPKTSAKSSVSTRSQSVKPSGNSLARAGASHSAAAAAAADPDLPNVIEVLQRLGLPDAGFQVRDLGVNAALIAIKQLGFKSPGEVEDPGAYLSVVMKNNRNKPQLTEAERADVLAPFREVSKARIRLIR
ncbi:MAG: hypothetical protein AB7J35_00060 [Dehalococcoidia bacterium]